MTQMFEQKLEDILVNYEFQVVAMGYNDTGEKQRAEAKAAIMRLVEEEKKAMLKQLYNYRIGVDDTEYVLAQDITDEIEKLHPDSSVSEREDTK